MHFLVDFELQLLNTLPTALLSVDEKKEKQKQNNEGVMDQNNSKIIFYRDIYFVYFTVI